MCSRPVGGPVRLQLFTWGWNQRGTLGHPPETKTESSPAPVEALAGVKIVQVSAGSLLGNAIRDLCNADGSCVSLGFGARRRSVGGIAWQWMTRGAPMLGVRGLGLSRGFMVEFGGLDENMSS